MRRRIRACMTVLAPFFFHAAVTAAATDEPDHFYYYFKEPRPLRLDTTRVAVFRMAPDAAQQSRAAGFDERLRFDQVTEMAVPDWVFVATAAAARDSQSLQDLIHQAGDAPIAEFISPVFLDDHGGPLIVTPDILIQFDRTLSPERAEDLLADFAAGEILDRDWAGMDRAYRLRSFSRNGFDVLEAANQIAQHPDVVFAEPDMLSTARSTLIPNDPLFSQLWGLHNTGQSGGLSDFDMDVPEAWDLTTGSASIIVVILDDGVQQNHPDLNQMPGFDATGQGTGGGPGNECDHHGTAVAGCVSAAINNNVGVVGVSPSCRIASARYTISNVPCDGGGMFFTSWFVNSLDWALSIGARITNTSRAFGSSSAITQKYDDTRNAGIVHFAATGNAGSSTIEYPASLPTVNAVAAVNRFGSRASFSNYGPGLAFSAPGQSINTTDRTGSAGYNSGDYASLNGTSFASPYAAGVAALILSNAPSLSAPQVEAVMQQSAVDLGLPGYDTDFGWGHLNARQALCTVIGPISDCNANGQSDACDLDDGTSDDCNVNAVPDECELTGNDCNANLIPDDCEPDPDLDGVTSDCDNCPLHANPAQADCDMDGIGDACAPGSPAYLISQPGVGGTTSTDPIAQDLHFDSQVSVGAFSVGFFSSASIGGAQATVTFYANDADNSVLPPAGMLVSRAINVPFPGNTLTATFDPPVPMPRDVWLEVQFDSAGLGLRPAMGSPLVGQTTGTSYNRATLTFSTINSLITVLADPDCNSDGLPDACGLGGAVDCNANGVPDECDYELSAQLPTNVRAVLAGAPAGGDGTSWATAFRTLQDALTAAGASGGAVTEIWVAAGTYRPDETNANPSGTGSRAATFQLATGLALYGGFTCGEAERAARDPLANPTILSGDLAGDDGPGFANYADNSYHVVTGTGADASALLDGFTITGGNANVSGDPDRTIGGGLFVRSGNPQIVGCRFLLNQARNGAETEGGGGAAGVGSIDLQAPLAAPTFSGCRFEQNEALAGGAVYARATSAPSFVDCVFHLNRTAGAFAGGGGACVHEPGSGAFSFDQCTFSSNSAAVSGGAIVSNQIALTCIDCTFIGNSAANSGGAIALLNGATTDISGSNFQGNSATAVGGAGGGAIFAESAAFSLTGCQFVSNTTNGQGGAIRGRLTGPVTITGCAFTNNSAPGSGGAIHAREETDPTITDSTFTGNTTVTDGGAIELFAGSDAVIERTTFAENIAYGGFPLGGGAIHNAAGQLRIRNCRFLRNTAWAGDGGAIRTEIGPYNEIFNSEFSGNSSAQHGGAINLSNSATGGVAHVRGCSMTANSAGNSAGGAIHVGGTEILNLRNSILWGNADPTTHTVYVSGGTVNLAYCNLQGITGPNAPAPGPTDINTDPLWVDADGPDDTPGTLDDDLHLMLGSPCIDAGDPAFVPAPGETDIDGDPRVRGCCVDMGADETQPPDCNANGLDDYCDTDCGTIGGPCDVPGCGASSDCNANSIPDECEPDCNNNGVADSCDISAEVSTDCNANDVPDECELPYNDCNANGVLDECDVRARFVPLGFIPGGGFSSAATAISANGLVIVGHGSSTGLEAFRWESGVGMLGLGDLPGGTFASMALGVSAEGSVVAGWGAVATGAEAFRWTSSDGMVGLGDLPGGGFYSEAFAVSGDGSVVVGRSHTAAGHEAFRWTSGGGMVGLGDLPGGDFRSIAFGASPDGTIIVGDSNSGSGREAFRWSAGNGMVGLGDLPGGLFDSTARGVSADGSVVIGWSGAAAGAEAFRWTQTEGMMGLGVLPGDNQSLANAVSADGSVIVGYSVGSDHRAFIWDQNHGMRSVADILAEDFGVDLAGWTLSKATGVSADGLSIVGEGINPAGRSEAWLVRLPVSEDCNSNGIPDECDIAESDCNANGIPDDCDLTTPSTSVTLDFQSLAADGTGTTVVPPPYLEDGFRLTIAQPSRSFGAYQSGAPNYPGSAALHAGGSPLDIIMRADGGLHFNIHSIRLCEDPVGSPNPTNVTFVGTRADNSTVMQVMSMDGVFGFQTFSFTGFTNLRELTWNQGQGGGNQWLHQFDDIVVSIISGDCNANGIPDECELPGNDCNANAIPDDCDPDADADGHTDDCDNCPAAPNPGQQDLDGDAVGDACDCDADGDGADSDAGPCGGTDCDDLNPAVAPAQPEICDNGIDDNCDGMTDEEDAACSAPCACGDLNGNGLVELGDFSTLAVCYSGTGGTRPPGCQEAEYTCADLDADGDVDLSDFATFSSAFGLPPQGSPPNCN